MKKISEMSLNELAAYIYSYLKSNNVECILSGGACVSIYTHNKYMSGDLDFIERYEYKKGLIKRLMIDIGFIEKNRYYIHPETTFFIEFPPGPLAVGSEPVRHVIELVFETGSLKLLSPTDCVKDRLAAFYYWDDHQSLEQAIMVFKENHVDLDEVERWSKVENQHVKYLMIKNRFK